jgi:2-oxoisovalerate dehydrogenase E1 component
MPRSGEGRVVRKVRFSEERIIGILKESEAGVEKGELCRKHGITRAIFSPRDYLGSVTTPVLEEMGAAKANGDPAVESEMWSRAFLIRCFEERVLKLFSEGKLFGTVHTCIGQEFTGITLAECLLDGDFILSNHRCHGHYLARTGDVDGLMAEVMGRATGICGGRGGSQHICSAGVLSNGVQGGMMPVSAGMALAQKLKRTNNIAVCFIGDGTLGEGIVYETLNIVSKWDIPLLVILENNGYAQSTPQYQTLAGDIAARAKAFGTIVYQGSTTDPKRLTMVMDLAVQQVREEHRPVFVCVDTYRLMAHSKGDDDRSRDEVERYLAKDPLTCYSEDHPEEAVRLRSAAELRVSSAVEAALAAPFASLPSCDIPSQTSPAWRPTVIEARERVVARIHKALREQMAHDDRAFILGEDIEGPYGGAFKVTKDLSLLYPSRVRNTPISEAAIVGIANGLALAGMHPICEIMFGDFLSLAADQFINHASKFRWMYNDQVTVPVVIRTPMGGRRGYGATHSQCLEKHFLGLPGTRVLAIHHRYDPYAVYRRLFATIDRPTLVIENKVLYAEYVTHKTIDGFWSEHTDEDFPTTRIRSHAKPDITIICYGGMLSEAEKAANWLFEEHEIVAEINCPVQIYPLRVESLLESVRASRRVLVVEEGQSFCGFGAEVLAALHEACPDSPLLTRRHAAAPHPLSCSKPSELESVPGAASIVKYCLEMVGRG